MPKRDIVVEFCQTPQLADAAKRKWVDVRGYTLSRALGDGVTSFGFDRDAAGDPPSKIVQSDGDGKLWVLVFWKTID